MSAPQQMDLPIVPRRRVRLEDAPAGAAELTTPWSDAVPPCSGLWDVRYWETGYAAGRWWWDERAAEWHEPQENLGARRVRWAHEAFRELFEWRGLASPSRDVYPCPPYSSLSLVQRAQAAGLTLRTTYVSIAPAPRRRVRL